MLLYPKSFLLVKTISFRVSILFLVLSTAWNFIATLSTTILVTWKTYPAVGQKSTPGALLSWMRQSHTTRTHLMAFYCQLNNFNRSRSRNRILRYSKWLTECFADKTINADFFFIIFFFIWLPQKWNSQFLDFILQTIKTFHLIKKKNAPTVNFLRLSLG